MRKFNEISIVATSLFYVEQLQAKNETPKKQKRINHNEINFSDIDPEMKDLGRQIADCRNKGLRVRVPAMRGSEWAHVLRALEQNRALM